nr:unnamed protein product [Naegleria fowleri]
MQQTQHVNVSSLKFDFSKINIPNQLTPIHKEECCVSFDTPKSEGGLNVCLNTFLAFSQKFVRKHFELTGNSVFLNIKRIKKWTPPEEKKLEEVPTKMAIGVEGGFNIKEEEEDDKDQYDELLSLVLLEPNNVVIPLPNNDLPEKVKLSIKGVLENQAVERKKEVLQWEGEPLTEGKHTLTLKQVGDVKIPPSGWKCSQCDITDNLWLNLSDGHIGCGRKFWDGSGGNNHAVEHYQQTGFPVCVKLGTIQLDENGEPKADVYSYAEDKMVKDSKLVEHLEYFGINIREMKKTAKTLAEMELDQNLNFDFTRIQESDKNLQPLYGPGFTGMKNIGNSCYLASVMQTLFSLPEFQKRYYDREMSCYTSTSSIDTLSLQMAKLAYGLLSGEYSREEFDENNERRYQEGIPPRSFKSVVGKGHAEFSTMRQQDSVEFYQYLLQLIEREDKRVGFENSITHLFNFKVEERIECSESKKVKYTHRKDNLLSLPVPLSAATNKAEYEEFCKREKEREAKEKELGVVQNVNSRPLGTTSEKKEVVRPKVPLSKCLEAFAEVDAVENFYSSALGRKTIGLKQTKLSTFPDYLFVQIRKFVLDGWVPKKLDVFITDAEELDLTSIRGTGLKPNEQELPSDEPKQESIYIDMQIVQSLVEMGIPENRAKRGAWKTNNVGLDAAMDWVFDHSGDADIDEPIPEPSKKQSGNASSNAPSDSDVEAIMNLGFPKEHAVVALKQTSNNIERAAEWLFSHMDDIDQYLREETSASTVTAKVEKHETFSDGSGKYELIGFVSHIGANTGCGHYVCHLKREVEGQQKWVLYNDSKVLVSENPPFDMGYLYLYKRK